MMIKHGGFLSVAMAGILALALVGDVQASYDKYQQKCRSTLAKNGSKLAATVAKTLGGCHKNRAKEKISSSVDCNDISQADIKGKVAKTESKLRDAIGGAKDKCPQSVVGTPGDLHFHFCPAPCDVTVPAIATFADVAECQICLIETSVQAMSASGQGAPGIPMGKDEAKCHGTIGKTQGKHLATILKERTKCQSGAEKGGDEDNSSCIAADPKGKIAGARSKGESSFDKSCTAADLSSVGSCAADLASLKTCVFDDSDTRGSDLFDGLTGLGSLVVCGDGATGAGEDCDDGNSDNTDTCLNDCTDAFCGDGYVQDGVDQCDDGNLVAGDCCDASCQLEIGSGCQHPECPSSGSATLWAGTGGACASDLDCPVGTCNLTIGRCQTVTELDSGTTGIGHDADVNDSVTGRGRLLCEGPPGGGGCGECDLQGIDPSTGNCRCENDLRVICDEPFAVDNDDCGGNTCQCFLGSPFPLASGGIAVCVVSRFAQDLTGTGNVDTGQFGTVASLRTQVFLGLDSFNPCPTCDGDAVYDDGVRDGICSFGRNLGESCDSTGINHTFPTVRKRCSVTAGPCEVNSDCPNAPSESCENYTPASPGGVYSLDCMPATGKNVSGQGLPIDLTVTTGTRTMTATKTCPFPFGASNCHCLQCSGDSTVPCNNDAECAAVGAGTCDAVGSGTMSGPDPCISYGTVCTATTGNEAECPGVVESTCDGLVKSSGEGYISCASDADCQFGVLSAGNCTLNKTRECYLPTIQADGVASPGSPQGASVFCIAPVSSAGVNSAVGLPGPGRVVQQLTTTSYCANNPAQVYTPGDPSSCQ